MNPGATISPLASNVSSAPPRILLGSATSATWPSRSRTAISASTLATGSITRPPRIRRLKDSFPDFIRESRRPSLCLCVSVVNVLWSFGLSQRPRQHCHSPRPAILTFFDATRRSELVRGGEDGGRRGQGVRGVLVGAIGGIGHRNIKMAGHQMRRARVGMAYHDDVSSYCSQCVGCIEQRFAFFDARSARQNECSGCAQRFSGNFEGSARARGSLVEEQQNAFSTDQRPPPAALELAD